MGIEDTLKTFTPTTYEKVSPAREKLALTLLEKWGIDLKTKTDQEKKDLIEATKQTMLRAVALGLSPQSSPDDIVAHINKTSLQMKVPNTYDAVIDKQSKIQREAEFQTRKAKRNILSEESRINHRAMQLQLATKYHTKSTNPSEKELATAMTQTDAINTMEKYSDIKKAITQAKIQAKDIPKAMKKADEKAILLKKIKVKATMEAQPLIQAQALAKGIPLTPPEQESIVKGLEKNLGQLTKHQFLHPKTAWFQDFFGHKEVISEINPAEETKKDPTKAGPALAFVAKINKKFKQTPAASLYGIWAVGKTLLQLNKELKGGGDKK